MRCVDKEYDDEAGDEEEGGTEGDDTYWLRYSAGSHEWQQSYGAGSEEYEDSCDDVVCCFGIHIPRIVAMKMPIMIPHTTPRNSVAMRMSLVGSGRCFMVYSE